MCREVVKDPSPRALQPPASRGWREEEPAESTEDRLTGEIGEKSGELGVPEAKGNKGGKNRVINYVRCH